MRVLQGKIRFYLQDIGKNVYTIADVVSEIRDKATRQRLQVLPYKLIFKEPDAESIRVGMYVYFLISQ